MNSVVTGDLFNVYLEGCRQALFNGASFILLDKKFMIKTFGSVFNGLAFFHKIFVELSKERRLKFYIQTAFHDKDKFKVIWIQERYVVK